MVTINNNAYRMILSLIFASIVIAEDGIYYRAYDVNATGSLRKKIIETTEPYLKKIKEVNLILTHDRVTCRDFSKGRVEERRCVEKANEAFRLKHKGLSYTEYKKSLSFGEKYFNVANVYSGSDSSNKVGMLGIVIMPKEINSSKIVEVIALKKIKTNKLTMLNVRDTLLAKDFKNNRMKLFMNGEYWIDVDESKELFKFKEGLFQDSPEVLKKKYSLEGSRVACGQIIEVDCYIYCGVHKINNKEVIFANSKNFLETFSLKEILNENGELECYPVKE